MNKLNKLLCSLLLMTGVMSAKGDEGSNGFYGFKKVNQTDLKLFQLDLLTEEQKNNRLVVNLLYNASIAEGHLRNLNGKIEDGISNCVVKAFYFVNDSDESELYILEEKMNNFFKNSDENMLDMVSYYGVDKKCQGLVVNILKLNMYLLWAHIVLFVGCLVFGVLLGLVVIVTHIAALLLAAIADFVAAVLHSFASLGQQLLMVMFLASLLMFSIVR